MLRRYIVCVLSLFMLSACETQEPSQTRAPVIDITPAVRAPVEHSLNAWWGFYNDATLDRIISSALSLNTQTTDKKTLQLISDLLYAYLEYRYTQSQNQWLTEYLDTAAPSEEEETALKAQKKAYQAKLQRLKKQITTLSKLLPEFIDEITRAVKPLPRADITPLLASETALLDPMPGAFTHTTINRVFGLNDSIFTGQSQFWKIVPGTAEKNMLRPSAQTRQKVITLERDLIAYTHLREQTRILEQALSRQDASSDQNAYYKARLGVLRARYERVKALSKIYLALGVY